MRVVSVTPATTEAVFAIGAGHLLVGRTDHCDFPPEASALPSIGGFSTPSLEAVLSLRPTLVVGAQGPAGRALDEGLRAAGVETYQPRTETVAEIAAMLRGLGDRLAAPGGERAAAEIEARRAEVEAHARGRPRVRALFVFEPEPLIAAGPGSYPDELLAIAGGENVINAGGAYPKIGVEALLRLAPDVVLDGSGPMGAGNRLRGAPGLRDLAAVRAGKVRTLDARVLRPGPRVAEGLPLLAELLRA